MLRMSRSLTNRKGDHMTDTIKFDCELTDTFSGEANYSWVRRATIEVPKGATHRSIVIAGKRALNLTGVRCVTDDAGDLITLRPLGMCQIAFITYRDE